MKKIAIFFLILVVIVVIVAYIYIDYQQKQAAVKKENQFYEYYLNKEINGLELSTIINKVVDTNTKNEVNKDDKGYYIENEKSIKIDIKFIDNDTTYKMEDIYKGKISEFASYYGQIVFKCTNIDYHTENGKVKYMLFEQMTV